jgi:uncharacterized lipoprotein YmbA
MMAVLVMAAAIAGCGRAPASRYYLLQPREGHDTLPALQTTIDGLVGETEAGLRAGVRPFHVDPPYDQDRIVYRVGRDAVEVGFYPYDRWAVPLSRMLPSLVAELLGEATGIASMEPVVAGRTYDALLEGHLLALEEIDTPDGQYARLRLLLLLRAQGDDGILWEEAISREAVTQAEDVGDVVTQMRALVEDALTEARPQLEAALSN